MNKRKITKYLFLAGIYIVIYRCLVVYHPLLFLTNDQGAAFNEFLVSLGNPNAPEAYLFVFNSVYISVHIVAAFIILQILVGLFRLGRRLYRQLGQKNKKTQL